MLQLIRRLICLIWTVSIVLQTFQVVGFSKLFAYHPVAMVLGWQCMVENLSLLPLRGKSKVERTWALALHVYGEGIAVALLSLGGAIIYWNKEQAGKSHLSSNHAWLGVAALTALIVQLALGLYLHYYSAFTSETGTQRARSRKQIKECHRLLGLLCVIVTGAALSLAFESTFATTALHSHRLGFGSALPYHIFIALITLSVIYQHWSE